MRVDTMRAVDRWAGIPLTWLLTFWRRLTALLMRPGSTSPRRVLFIELSEMGSTILADPAMRKAREQLGAEIYFLIFHRNRESLELTGTVAPENIRTIRENNPWLLALDTWRCLRWIRREEIDTVIDLELFSRFTALLSGLSGALRRIGFYAFHNEGLYRGELLTHRVAYNPHQHIARNFLALVNSLLAPSEELPFSKTIVHDEDLVLPRRQFSKDELDTMRSLVGRHAPAYDSAVHRLILINPNASELLPQRRWPSERYEALIRRILVLAPDLMVLITGAPSEQAEAAALCGRIGDARCASLAGALRLAQLPLLYSIATLMVTNDSGPAHFAAVTAMPLIVLFGPETPALYGSLGNAVSLAAGLSCSPCVSATNHRRTPCCDNVCMRAIGVERVLDEVRRVVTVAG